MAHLDELTIELYVMHSDAVKKRRKDIARHLRVCSGCAALHAEVERYYSQVEALQSEQDKRASQALYAPERGIRHRAWEETAPTVPIPKTLPQRFVESFRLYPLRWSTGLILVAALFVFLLPRLSSSNVHPAFARAEREFLVVYNSQRTELWRKHIGMMIDDNSLPDYSTVDSSRGFPIVDVDQDGTPEVIGVFGWAVWTVHENPWLNVLACFNADGTERWRYTLHRQATLGGTPFADDYRFYKVMVGDYDANGKFEVIGLASHIPWFPNVLVRLDAESGTLLSEYWHNGMVGHTTHRDIDGDGIEELFFGGQNNRFQQANLLVLDPQKFYGTAPAPAEYRPDGIPSGSEKYYLLFPASDLKPYWADITNDVIHGLYWRGDSTLEVPVRERVTFAPDDPSKPGTYEEGALYYYLDSSMRCVRVRVSDSFSAIWAKYRRLGLVKEDLDAAYLEKLRQGVQYWDGEKFVSEPVMNRKYQKEKE